MHYISISTGWAASLAGLAWIAKDLGSRLSPDPDYWDCNSSYDYALNAIDTIAFVLLVPVFNLLEHCAGMDALGFAYVIGTMVGFLLLLVFAVALTRVRLIPTWASWLLVVGTAAGLLLANQGGFIVFGLAWAVLGYVLYRHPPSEEIA